MRCAVSGKLQRTVIEFFGMPGAGKSTLAESFYRATAADHQSIGCRALEIERMTSAVRRLVKILLVGRLWGLRPLVAIRSTALVLRRVALPKPSSIWVVVNWWYLHALVDRQLASYECTILDQGIGQAIWSMCFRDDSARKDDKVSELVGDFLRKNGIQRLLVVHVKTDPELVRRRLQTRRDGRSPLDGNVPDGKFRLAEDVTSRVAAALSRASEIYSEIELLECDNNEEVDEVAKKLRAKLCASGRAGESNHANDLE